MGSIRQLNPYTRLILCSEKKLNRLLCQRLGNFIAFDPRELSTTAFALAGLGTEIQGYFDLNSYVWQIERRSIYAKDPWCDRLVVLSTIDGLRRIEQGKLNLEAKQWQVRVERALTPDAIFEGANYIAKVTGCSLTLARETMNDLPQILPLLLYQLQAQRLTRELKKNLVISHAFPSS